MTKKAGLWIDHRKAVIVIVTEAGEEIKEIPSNMEKHTRFTGGTASMDGSTEDVRDRKFGNNLNSYYDLSTHRVDAAAVDAAARFEVVEESNDLHRHQALQALMSFPV